ncbi:hypothetical protein MRB53_042036 [Persea americana]|nr:hypothetical protein MRB53_042036 [Persea americana]
MISQAKADPSRYHLRRALLRASSACPSALASSPVYLRPLNILASASRASTRIVYPTARGYADGPLDSAKEYVQDAAESAKETVAGATRQASSAFDSIAEAVGVPGSRSTGSRFHAREPAPPNTNLYIGNLFFEVTEAKLAEYFGRYGPIKSTKIVFDGRGLSKGYGYVEYEDLKSAEEAVANLDTSVLEGRRISVQYAVHKERSPRPDFGAKNPPTKTLFIGNMSYEMSDKDLNELFRPVKDVTDVRVAIDRRTGQPRGFAHADFITVEAAQEAAKYLESKEYYGRKLRVDFSGASTRSTTSPPGSGAGPQ